MQKYDISPFRLSDVTFSVVCTVFDTATVTDKELAAAVFVILVLTTHKNCVRGDKIGHGDIGDPYCVQKRHCVVRWTIYYNMVPPLTPLSPILRRLGAVGQT